MQEDCESLSWETNSVPAATFETQHAVIDAARQVGLTSVAHATSYDSTRLVLEAGVNGLAHTFFDRPHDDEIISLHVKTGAFVIPTLSVIASMTSEDAVLKDSFVAAATDCGILDEYSRELMLRSAGASAPGAKLQYAYDVVRQLCGAGVDIVAGTDAVAGLPGMAIGPSLWMELEQYVLKCGMTAEQALRSATATPARRLGFMDRGLIASGKRADLVLVRGLPHNKLNRLWERGGIVQVWKQGLEAC